MKTAVIQLKATDNKEKNIQKAVSLVHEAISRRAEFVVLPEVFVFRGLLPLQQSLSDIAETIPGESHKPLMALAKKHRIFIQAGSVFEKIKNDRRVYNTSVVIDNHGKIKAVYRKMHLFDAVLGPKKIQESKKIKSGQRPVLTRVGPFSIGLSICYDVRFPNLYQYYSSKDVNILTIPSAFTKQTGQAHWEVLLRSRAIENLCYVLAPNQIGSDTNGVTCYGHSMIVDPWGKILAKAGANTEGVIYADLSMKAIDSRRKILPSLKNRPPCYFEK